MKLFTLVHHSKLLRKLASIVVLEEQYKSPPLHLLSHEMCIYHVYIYEFDQFGRVHSQISRGGDEFLSFIKKKPLVIWVLPGVFSLFDAQGASIFAASSSPESIFGVS